MSRQDDAKQCLLWAAEWQQMADNTTNDKSRNIFEQLAARRIDLAERILKAGEPGEALLRAGHWLK